MCTWFFLDWLVPKVIPKSKWNYMNFFFVCTLLNPHIKCNRLASSNSSFLICSVEWKGVDLSKIDMQYISSAIKWIFSLWQNFMISSTVSRSKTIPKGLLGLLRIKARTFFPRAFCSANTLSRVSNLKWNVASISWRKKYCM